MNVIKVNVINMLATDLDTDRRHSPSDYPKYPREYTGQLDFNGMPFTFKFHPDTYRTIHGSYNNEAPNHRFEVVGLDLVTLEKVGTTLDFSDAIEIFNKRIEEYKVEMKKYQEKERRKILENCLINKNREFFIAAGFTVPTVDEVMVKNNLDNIGAYKKIVNPINSNDTDIIRISISSNGAYEVYLNYDNKSNGRITKIENAIKKAGEFEKEWINKKQREYDSNNYQNKIRNHIIKTFKLKEVEESDITYRDHKGNYKVTGQKFLIATSTQGSYNGSIFITCKENSKGGYRYGISESLEFNEEECMEIVAIMKRCLDRKDEADRLESLARKAKEQVAVQA